MNISSFITQPWYHIYIIFVLRSFVTPAVQSPSLRRRSSAPPLSEIRQSPPSGADVIVCSAPRYIVWQLVISLFHHQHVLLRGRLIGGHYHQFKYTLIYRIRLPLLSLSHMYSGLLSSSMTVLHKRTSSSPALLPFYDSFPSPISRTENNTVRLRSRRRRFAVSRFTLFTLRRRRRAIDTIAICNSNMSTTQAA